MRDQNRIQIADCMLEKAPQYYGKLAYHNFDGHVLQTIEDSRKLIEWLDQNGIPVDENIVTMALAYHDARFQDDHTALGYDTKEQLSAATARYDMREFGASDYLIQTVSDAIIATTATVEPKTNLEKVVRLADVGNVAGDPAEFLRNTYLLLLESVQRGLPIPDSFEQFCQNSQRFLEFYYKQPIEFHYRGKTLLYEPKTGFAQKNIRFLGTLTLGTFINTVSVIVPDAEQKLRAIWNK